MNFFDVANGNLLFILVGAGIVFIILQSIFFLWVALKRASEIGISKRVIANVMKSSAIFTIAPSIAVALGLAALAPSLGIPWPWFRLSVIGSVSYELMAAKMASSALGFATITEASQNGPMPLGAIMLAMTSGLAGAIVMDLIFIKKVDSIASKLKAKNGEFGIVGISVLFFAVLAVFIAPIFGLGWVPTATFLTSVLLTLAQGILARKPHFKWLKNFVLTFSLIIAMVSSILWTFLLN